MSCDAKCQWLPMPCSGDDTLDHLLRELLRSSGEVTVEEFPESRKDSSWVMVMGLRLVIQPGM